MALPDYVASGELIESAWGNAVVDTLNVISVMRAGTASGGPIAAGTQAAIASIILPAGAHLVFHQVQCNSTAELSVTLRMFVGGSPLCDALFRYPPTAQTCQIIGGFSTATAATTVTVNLINSGTATVDTYADANNHRIWALTGRV